jgi:RNA ligase
MTIYKRMEIQFLHQLIDEGYIYAQQHPDSELTIYNYSPKAQYERVWNEWTLLCRGLIMDRDYQIIARPFRKFFNLSEHDSNEIPIENFEVFEKLDGSLGILYPHKGQYFIATRGSFDSKQAIKANALLHTKYAHTLPLINPQKTYLFEIIYPENRIVIDYGQKEELILLAVIDKETGKEEELPEIGFPVVKRYDGIHDLYALQTLQEVDREGFVIRFDSGFRVKVKFEEYVRLHRILTRVSSKNIWEYLSTNQSFEAILDKVPDEFYDWVKNTVDKLTENYQKIENYCKENFKDLGNRKDTALYFQTLLYPSVLFSMLDKRDYSPIIWKMIKPEYEKPFRESSEDDT